MDPQTMHEDFERASSMARALASLDVPGAAGLSFLTISLSIVLLFAVFAVTSLIPTALPEDPAEGPIPGPCDILYGCVVFGMGLGAVECLCGALVYLCYLVTGEVAWS